MGDGGFCTTVIVGILRCFCGLKCPGPDADPVSSCGAEVRNARGGISTFPYTLCRHAQGKLCSTPSFPFKHMLA